MMEEQDKNNVSEPMGGGMPASGPKDRFLPVSILVAAIVIGGSIVFATVFRGTGMSGTDAGVTQQGTPPVPAAIMNIGSRDAVWGDPNAPVTLVEYGDYQCPFCASFFAQTQAQVAKNYIDTGKVKMVFRNFIVNDRTSADHESHNSALAAECSKDQNKFWAFHDAIYSLEVKDEAVNPQGAENNGNLTRAAFLGIAKSLGMDLPQFTACYDSGKYTSTVQAESDQAAAYGVNATPSFFANGVAIIGAEPYASFKQLFDGLLKK